MGNIPSTDVHLKFAILSLVAVAAIAFAIAFFGGRTIEPRMEDAAGKAAASALGSAVEASLAGADLSGPLPSWVEAELGTLVQQSSSSGTLGLRLWNYASEVVYSSDAERLADAPPERAGLAAALEGQIVTSARPGVGESSGPDFSRDEVLVTYVPLGAGGILEIQQDYAVIAADVADARRSLYVGVGVEMAGLYVVLQLLMWVGGRALRREYDRLRLLHRSGEGVRSSLDLADVLGQLVREATTVARGQLGVVTLVEEGTSDLVLRASYDRRKGVSTQHSRKVEEWFLRRSVATGKTIITTQPAAPYESVFGYESPKGASVTMLCVPMVAHDRVIGTITVFRPTQSGQFQSVEISLVEEMAAQAAVAVEQASLFSMVRAYAHRLEQSYDTTLKVLMAALDAKDRSTEGHSERVAGLTVATAREMGVPEEQLVDLERGALLHDVGKIGVPDAVLRKPTALNRQEWESMQRHPLLAGLMVSKVEFLEGALPILLYHHEHYDGSGYPFGLAGDRIPLEARVFAVVDAYDAMTSSRPYREALSHEEAMKEIKAQAGSQFDPEVTAAFERIMAEHLGLQEEEAERPAA